MANWNESKLTILVKSVMLRVETNSTHSEQFLGESFPCVCVRRCLGTSCLSHLLTQLHKEFLHTECLGSWVLGTAKNTVVCNTVVIYVSTVRRKLICGICYLSQTCFCWALHQHHKTCMELLLFYVRKKNVY